MLAIGFAAYADLADFVIGFPFWLTDFDSILIFVTSAALIHINRPDRSAYSCIT